MNRTKLVIFCLVALVAGFAGILFFSAEAQSREVPPYLKLDETPALIKAAALGEGSRLESLIAGGAELDQRDSFGLTALHAAVLTQREDLVKLLLSKGASLDPLDLDGRTPLYIACELNQLSLVSRLVEAGAEVARTNALGISPLTLAVANGAPEILLVLGAKQDLRLVVDSEGNSLLHTAALWGREEIAGELIGAGLDLDGVNHAGQTPLMLAAENRHAFVARLLIENGASLEPSDREGRTVLHWGVIGGHPAVVGDLLGAGVRDRADFFGLTAEDYARRRPLVMIEEIFSQTSGL